MSEPTTVFVVGKRNSGFEVAQGILPWARSIVLGSPRPVQTDALALSALRVRYLHPYDEYARGGPGTYVIDVTIERIDRVGKRLRVSTRGTTWDGALEFEVDDGAYVFGDARPKNSHNRGAGIDVSPAVRDYLVLADIDRVDWQFVGARAVPVGPWKAIVTTSAVTWH